MIPGRASSPPPPTRPWVQALNLAGFCPPFLGPHQVLHAGPSLECVRRALLRSHSTAGETEAEAGERSTRKHAAEAGLETRVPREAWMLCPLLGAVAKGTLLPPRLRGGLRRELGKPSASICSLELFGYTMEIKQPTPGNPSGIFFPPVEKHKNIT